LLSLFAGRGATTDRPRWANDWKPRRLLAFLRSASAIPDDELVLFVDG
jgi:hypothetical protein